MFKKQVFDIVLNGEHTIVSGLDIFEKVGRGIAHDEYIPFKIQGQKLMYNDEESDIVDKRVKIDFIKVKITFNVCPHFLFENRKILSLSLKSSSNSN